MDDKKQESASSERNSGISSSKQRGGQHTGAKEIDAATGVETTGHEWDGLKELNNPLPRWWVWVFLATCLWSLWYFVIYPAWPIPGGSTDGLSNYSQYKELAQSQLEIHKRQQQYLDRFEQASFNDILSDPALYAFAMAGGRSAFKDNCATCHGSGAQGGRGYPNLNDDDWLWGGSIEEIYATILHGVRVPGDYDTRTSQMPAFGASGMLSRKEITTVIDYILALSAQDGKVTQSNKARDLPGYPIFQQNCASCHGENGQGSDEFGAPNLTDPIWLYGGRREDLYKTIFYSHAGMMPAWKDRLGLQTIRQLAVYVHQLGGGERAPANEAAGSAPHSSDPPDQKHGQQEAAFGQKRTGNTGGELDKEPPSKNTEKKDGPQERMNER